MINNYNHVIKNIQETCKSCGRNPETVRLVAVSKTHPVEELRRAYDLGIRDFGENKVQELTEKIHLMPKDVRWHMIGHLQSNKIKKIIAQVYMIHSIDSLKLLEALEYEAAKAKTIVHGLLEVNISGEESKYGFSPKDIYKAINVLSEFGHVKIHGLMTMAPFSNYPEDSRSVFSNLQKLSVDIKAQNADNVDMDILSMGMTNDYMVAIEEGSTVVRVGTGIFGRRHGSISHKIGE